MAWDVMQLLVGGGSGGVLGYIGGAIQRGMSLEASYNKRVDERLRELEKKVAECEKERPLIAVLKMGMCMVVPEMQRLDGENPVLRNVADAFRSIPQATNDDLSELLAKLREID